ncbi:MAG: glutathione S-transferase N-terminal domain-containing protein [Rhizobiaceae bacterium]|nr:glutathione S-transferase N-terminal domain-containing protein [Hyphomicrobiales bacterium]NRB31250.1 glutathione S-transferase N-terminal domain-containing protein [Rhizobiaceae bacterium]
MIDLYTFGTPNGRKVSIALEEMELAYQVTSVDIMKNEQFHADFLKISPNNKIPAIVDHQTGISLMESGAILYYLATKSGRFLPKDPHHHWQALEWLNWQMGGFGPMLGQAHHFLHFNPGRSDYAEERFGEEAKRLYGVLDRQLYGREYVAGEYSIADMAIWPWAARFEYQKIDLNAFPNVLRWYQTVAARPAVGRGYSVPVATEIPLP